MCGFSLLSIHVFATNKVSFLWLTSIPLRIYIPHLLYVVIYWWALRLLLYLDYWLLNEHVVVQSLSCVQLCDPMDCSTPGLPIHHQNRGLPKLMSIESVMPSNHLICSPLLLLPSVFLNIRVFLNESALRIRWPKYWSFSFNISPSNEHPGLISFRMDWLDLLAVQGILKSLLQ